MALPRHLKKALTPAEIEFLAECQTVVVAPSHRLPKLDLITSGPVEAFRPPIKRRVPLWLALSLHKMGKCDIEKPAWVEKDSLEQARDSEKREANFAPLPYHWVETAHILLERLRGQWSDADEIQNLIKDLVDERERKARQGLEAMDTVDMKLDNMGLMELNEIRPFFVKAFNQLRKLDPEGVIGNDAFAGDLTMMGGGGPMEFY